MCFFSSIWHPTRAPSEEGKGQAGARETLSLFITSERILMLKEGFGIHVWGDVDWEIKMRLPAFAILPLFAQIRA